MADGSMPRIIATVNKGDRANAKLIAAAPALLACVEFAVDSGIVDSGRNPETYKRFKAIIELAK